MVAVNAIGIKENEVRTRIMKDNICQALSDRWILRTGEGRGGYSAKHLAIDIEVRTKLLEEGSKEKPV